MDWSTAAGQWVTLPCDTLRGKAGAIQQAVQQAMHRLSSVGPLMQLHHCSRQRKHSFHVPAQGTARLSP